MIFLLSKKEAAKAAAMAMVEQGLEIDAITAFGKIFSVYDEKGIEYQKTFFEVIKPFNLEINKAERIQQAAIQAYLRKKFETLKPYPLVKPVLAKLRKKYKIGIVTDAPRNKAWQRLIISGLEKEFDFVITHDDTMKIKPNPSPFYLALEKLNLLAPACLFVGDNPDRDIKGAKELGMMTCWARYGSMRKNSDADIEIDSIGELVKKLEELSL